MSDRHSYTVTDVLQQEKSDGGDVSFLKILAPLQFTLECCSGIGQDHYINFLMTSPQGTNYYQIHTESQFRAFNARGLHNHDFYELMIVLDGEVHQQIEATDYVFKSGSCCLMNRNIKHRESFHTGATILFIGLSRQLVEDLNVDSANAYFPQTQQPDQNYVLRFLISNLSLTDAKEYLDFLPNMDNHDWYRVLHKLSDSILGAIMTPALGSSYIAKGMLLNLFEYLSTPANFHITPVHVESNSDFLLYSHVRHLMEDTNGRITRSELEKALNYSGNYLNTVVRKYSGLCLFDYGQTFCMKKAAEMLCTSAVPISDIMDALHFNNPTHFYKCFKEQYHMTPRQYRLLHMSQTYPSKEITSPLAED